MPIKHVGILQKADHLRQPTSLKRRPLHLPGEEIAPGLVGDDEVAAQSLGPDSLFGSDGVLKFALVFDGITDPDTGKVWVSTEPVASLPCLQGLGTAGSLGPACAKVEDSLAPVAQALLHESRDGVNLQPLRTPTESAIGRWIPSADYVYPE